MNGGGCMVRPSSFLRARKTIRVINKMAQKSARDYQFLIAMDNTPSPNPLGTQDPLYQAHIRSYLRANGVNLTPSAVASLLVGRESPEAWPEPFRKMLKPEHLGQLEQPSWKDVVVSVVLENKPGSTPLAIANLTRLGVSTVRTVLNQSPDRYRQTVNGTWALVVKSVAVPSTTPEVEQMEFDAPQEDPVVKREEPPAVRFDRPSGQALPLWVLSLLRLAAKTYHMGPETIAADARVEVYDLERFLNGELKVSDKVMEYIANAIAPINLVAGADWEKANVPPLSRPDGEVSEGNLAIIKTLEVLTGEKIPVGSADGTLRYLLLALLKARLR